MVSRHREAELAALLSPEFARLRESGSFALLNYADVVRRATLRPMRRPQ